MFDILLSQNERDWLLGNAKLSKGYQRKVKSDIKKKSQSFQAIELPLLLEKGFLSFDNHVTKFGNGVTTNCNTQNQSYSSNDNLSKKYGPDVIRTREPRHVKAVS